MNHRTVDVAREDFAIKCKLENIVKDVNILEQIERDVIETSRLAVEASIYIYIIYYIESLNKINSALMGINL